MQNIFNIENFKGNIYQNCSLAKYSYYKIGGNAKFLAEVKDQNSLQKLINYAKSSNIDWIVIGGGSNLLISDDGFDGLVVRLSGEFSDIIFDNNKCLCKCGAAVNTSKLINEYKAKKLSGAQFLVGIPGTVGGAVKMNAGRKTDWISSQIESVTILDSNYDTKTLNVNNINFGYRTSSIKDDEIVISVNLRYKKIEDDKDWNLILSEMQKYIDARKKSQPINMPSCGSVFKNPDGYFVAQLIEEAGLKGKKCGDAEISTKHANFIVNNGQATANDVVNLINLIQQNVYDKNQIKLKPEVKFIGFDKKCSLF